MSEAEDAAEQEALERDALEQQMAEENAFGACFPPEAFTGIAKALKIRPEPENLSRLRDWLLQDFYFYLYVGVPVKSQTRQERINRLKKVCEAAATLCSLLTSLYGNWLDLPLDWTAPDDLDGSGGDFPGRFVTMLRRLSETAAGEIEQLASRPSRRGRPAKNIPFRLLTHRLIRKYEQAAKQPASCPYYLSDSASYGGKGSFYKFALAVWRCLRDNLPAEARSAIPSTEGGLAEELKKYWPKDAQSGKNSHHRDPI